MNDLHYFVDEKFHNSYKRKLKNWFLFTDETFILIYDSLKVSEWKKNKCTQRVYRSGMKKLGIFSWKPKMQSAVNCGWIRVFFCWVKIHCALFFHFHSAAFKLDPHRRLTETLPFKCRWKQKLFKKHTHTSN